MEFENGDREGGRLRIGEFIEQAGCVEGASAGILRGDA